MDDALLFLNRLMHKYSPYAWIGAVTITLAVLFPVLQNGWVNWDDEGYVLQNPLLEISSLQELMEVFATLAVVGNYHPFTVLSLAIDHAIGGNSAFVYHLHSLLLHLANVALVFAFIRLLFKRNDMAFFVAVFFGIHPMHLESVAWVSARKDVLYAFWLLLGLLAYMRHAKLRARDGGQWFYVASLCCFLFSMLSKSMAVIFPFVLLCIDYVQGRHDWGRAIVSKLPFVFLSVGFSVLALISQQADGALWTGETLNLMNRLSVASWSFAVYIWKVIIPAPLSAFHPYPFKTVTDVPWFMYSALAIIPAFAFTCWKLRNTQRSIVFGLLFFAISLLPVLQLIPVGRAMMAERYTYLAYIGLFVVLYLLIEALQKRVFPVLDVYPVIKEIAIVLVLIPYASITHHGTEAWENGQMLWTQVIQTYPEDHFAYACRGDYFYRNGALEAAMRDFDTSVELNPNYSKVYNDRGRLHQRLGHEVKAHRDFSRAIELNPSFARAYVNRAQNRAGQQQLQAALDDLNTAINIDQHYAMAYLNRGALYEKLDQPENALADYSAAIASDFSNALFYRYRGALRLSLNAPSAAILDLTASIQLDSTDATAFFLRGLAYRAAGKDALSAMDSKRAQELGFKASGASTLSK